MNGNASMLDTLVCMLSQLVHYDGCPTQVGEHVRAKVSRNATGQGGTYAGEVSVRVCKAFETDGELDVARTHDVLNFEILRA
eukprot:1195489-Prorocentrum_minimum.AAC.7